MPFLAQSVVGKGYALSDTKVGRCFHRGKSKGGALCGKVVADLFKCRGVDLFFAEIVFVGIVGGDDKQFVLGKLLDEVAV